jgi:hypothetical protein
LFSPGPPVSSTNKADRHDITEIVLKVAVKHQQAKKKHNVIESGDMSIQLSGLI